jgi:hypothetical protein
MKYVVATARAYHGCLFAVSVLLHDVQRTST